MNKLMKMLNEKKGIPVKDDNQRDALRSVIMELKKVAQGMMADDIKGSSWLAEDKEKELPEGGLIAKVKMAKLDRLDNGSDAPDADEVTDMLKDESMTPGADAVSLEEEECEDGDDMDKLRALMKKKSKDGEK